MTILNNLLNSTTSNQGAATAVVGPTAMELSVFSTTPNYDAAINNISEMLDQVLFDNTSSVPSGSTVLPGNVSIMSESTLERMSKTYQGIHGYFSVIVCIFGIILNILNIIVLTRKHMRTPTNLLLTALAIADMLTMSTYPIMVIYLYIMTSPQCLQFKPHPKSWIYFILFHNLFIMTCHTIAMWLTVALAVFRYIFVCRHQFASTWCSIYRAKLTVFIVTAAAIVLCLPHFFLYQVQDNKMQSEDGRVCRWWIMPSAFAKNHPMFRKFLTSVFGVILKIAPCILLAFLSGLLICAMQRAKKRRARLLNNISRVIDSDSSSEHNRTTRMMVAVVLCFIITETPQGILALWNTVDTDFFQNVYVHLGDLMDILVLINSAINFILYTYMSQQFRDTFKSLFYSWHIPSCFQRVKKNNNHHVNGSEYSSVKTECTHV